MPALSCGMIEGAEGVFLFFVIGLFNFAQIRKPKLLSMNGVEYIMKCERHFYIASNVKDISYFL